MRSDRPAAAALPGYYGKLPGKGDFLSRGLPAGFRDAWDGWLEPAVHRARTALGEAWAEIYLTSPYWRFAAGAGLLGPRPVVGVMMPSVDGVGRFYPFVLTAPAAEGGSPFAWAAGGADWFAAAERTAAGGLTEQFDADAFAANLDALGPFAPTGRQTPRLLDGDPSMRRGWTMDAADVDAPGPGFYAALLDAAFGLDFPSYSLWWTRGSDRVAPAWLVYPGLPTPQAYAEMLAGFGGATV